MRWRKSVMDETKAGVDYLTGTMIELPRAAVRAHVIAETAEFFSFGTNDLTQTAFGISRDDAAPVPGNLPPEGHRRAGSVRHARHRGRRRTGEDGGRKGQGDQTRHQARHLRRARRRSRVDPLLPADRARLRVVLALPRADRPAGGGAGGDRQGRLTAGRPISSGLKGRLRLRRSWGSLRSSPCWDRTRRGP